jgi:membrane dipeptidase
MSDDAVVGDEVTEEARELHDRSVVIDMLDISRMGREHFIRMREGGITAANFTVTVQHGFCDTVEIIGRYNRTIEQNADVVQRVLSVQDILDAKEHGRTGIIYGLQNSCSVENDLRLVEPLHALGVRVIQLAYMTANLSGDGCLEPRNGGLTVFGGELVKELNRLGVLLDLSHCGQRTTLEAVDASATPVAITHACASALCGHPRNKSDEEIRALAARGGVVGVTSLASFVSDDSDDADLHAYVRHIEHVAELVGIDHVGIGMDFTEDLPFEALVPEKWGGTHVPTGIEGVADWPIRSARGASSSEEFPNITTALLSRGFSHEDVQKVLGGNFVRLMTETWAD